MTIEQEILYFETGGYADAQTTEAAGDWFRSLGLDPMEYVAKWALVHGAGGWHLRLGKVQHHPNGRRIYVGDQSAAAWSDTDLGPELPDLPWLHLLVDDARERATRSAAIERDGGLHWTLYGRYEGDEVWCRVRHDDHTVQRRAVLGPVEEIPSAEGSDG